ncbi:MAG TPA: hypothetical protein VJ440_05750 [Candidatus Brocadiaceae bacterium]|nr:hypothetical protein [Candidatus Brocadiaceae bacterium]
METFSQIALVTPRNQWVPLRQVSLFIRYQILVDTVSEYTWIPGEMLYKIDVVREKKDLAFIMIIGKEP